LDIRVVADFWIGALFSIADPQKFLPLAIVAFEPHAFGNPKGRDQASLNLLAALSGVIAI
jgi:hypothetical protein